MQKALLKMTAQEFVSIVSEYEGKLVGTKFSNLNTLHRRYNACNEETGKCSFVEKDTKVLCTIELTDTGLCVEESTLEILGGHDTPMKWVDRELIISCLEHYKFKHKEYEQLSLF